MKNKTEKINKPPAANIIIFGGFGDLAWRKLIPALYNLYIDGFMPEQFAIYGMHYREMPEGAYEKHMLEGVNSFSRSGKADPKQWGEFVKKLFFFQGDFVIEDTYTRLKTILNQNDKTWGTRATRLFYYSVSPGFIDDISSMLAQYKLATNVKKDRIVVEKPFGTDLKTAQDLNKLLMRQFDEKQIYRIDHYLGKEVVQNLMAFRFANYIFEPLWNNKYIDHVQISVTEKVSVGTRGNYYDKSGALRDMIQNHLLQLFSLVAMDCPKAYESESIRSAKVKALKQARQYTPATIKTDVVRAQYTAGESNGKALPGYHQEVNVAKDSATETYVAMKLFVDNARWKGVPFFLRTGKSLRRQASVIVIQFKNTPNKIFANDVEPNRLIISIQPEQEISLLFESKVPGIKMKLKPVEMDFTYKESYQEHSPEAYETLLMDVLEGDSTLFMRADHVEAAWKLVMPILNAWEKGNNKDLKKYKAGSWGPAEADKLIKTANAHWTLLAEQKEDIISPVI